MHITHKFGGAMSFHHFAIRLNTVTIHTSRLAGIFRTRALLVHL